MRNAKRNPNGLFSARGTIVPSTITKAMPNAVTLGLGKLQSRSQQIIQGSELIIDLVASSQDCDGKYHNYPMAEGSSGKVFDGWTLNPADLNLTPRLCAMAAQYTKFRCLSLTLTFISASSSNVPGNLYVACVPDPSTLAPTDVATMSGYLGYKQMSIWGTQQVWKLDKQVLQQMYNNQVVKTPALESDCDPTNTCGKLFIGFDGITSAVPVPIGKFTLTYEYAFMVPKTTTGANSAEGVYTGTDFTAGTAVRLTNASLLAGGHEMIYPLATAGDYCRRASNSTSKLIIASNANVNHTHVVSVSKDKTTWEALTVKWSSGFQTVTSDSWTIPAGYRYLRLAYSVPVTPSFIKVMMFVPGDF